MDFNLYSLPKVVILVLHFFLATSCYSAFETDVEEFCEEIIDAETCNSLHQCSPRFMEVETDVENPVFAKCSVSLDEENDERDDRRLLKDKLYFDKF